MEFYKIASYYIPSNSINYITELTEGKVKVYVIDFGNDNHVKVSASVAAELGIKEDYGKADEETEARKARSKKAK